MPKYQSYDRFSYLNLEVVIDANNAVASIGGGDLLENAQQLMRTHMYRYREEFAGKQLNHKMVTDMDDSGVMLVVSTTIEGESK